MTADKPVKGSRFEWKPGDEVFWEDPDDGLCSRVLTIASIEWDGDVVKIVDTDGGYLECFGQELK